MQGIRQFKALKVALTPRDRQAFSLPVCTLISEEVKAPSGSVHAPCKLLWHPVRHLRGTHPWGTAQHMGLGLGVSQSQTA